VLSIGLDKIRLRLWLGLFFVALALPTAVLVRQAYTQLKWEAFYQYRVLAEELATRIDGRLTELIEDQEDRRFADYEFLVVAGGPSSNFLQRSPLSDYPVITPIPGLLGYFQVDAEGSFSTPLLPRIGADPEAYGISTGELGQRRELANRLQQILRPAGPATAENSPRPTGLSSAPPAVELAQQMDRARAGSATLESSMDLAKKRAVGDLRRDFDAPLEIAAQLDKPRDALPGQIRVEELELDDRYQAEADVPDASLPAMTESTRPGRRVSRKEQSLLPEQASVSSPAETKLTSVAPNDLRIDVFESEIDPFALSLFDNEHFVLYRKVWRDGSRYIQGAIIQLQPFLQGVLAEAFQPTALSRMSDLVVAYEGNVLSALRGQSQRAQLYGAEDLKGSLLYRTRLSSPLDNLELIFTLTRLPPGPGSTLVGWTAALLTVVLAGGVFLMYRLGLRQIELSRQQQDFVSAVSHELKTPLTSIRMYGEMLREGWASEEKKQSYYGYIHDESERLSRLIGNILQLARLTRNDLPVDLKTVSVGELMEAIRSKILSHAERSGFGLELDCDVETGAVLLRLDLDCLSQIFINLVDNAIKFSVGAPQKKIDLGCRLNQDGQVMFSVRDYGPGVPSEQMKKIFKLFYRTESELTRETIGTGIGLALVKQLVQRMSGQVDVVNRDPGAEFRLYFPIV
jgi:signal transduction histidine kinase